VALNSSLAEVCQEIELAYGLSPRLIATSARDGRGSVTCVYLRRLMEEQGGNFLLLLGTGWGLAPEVLEQAEFRLQPIYGVGEYNHLSVRSAASIMLDRIMRD
ncbi:MAG: RNA methyltransferase, partial [Clostridiales bacterium]|nr:RNA methyltransferase [Clostridiales bacterium]